MFLLFTAISNPDPTKEKSDSELVCAEVFTGCSAAGSSAESFAGNSTGGSANSFAGCLEITDILHTERTSDAHVEPPPVPTSSCTSNVTPCRV